MRGSLTGSVIGNLLLVLGFSLLFGGKGRLDRESSLISFGLVAFAVAALPDPVDPGLGGRPRPALAAQCSRCRCRSCSCVVYVVVTWYSLRRHRLMHVVRRGGRGGRLVPPALARRALGGDTSSTAFVAEILVHTLEAFADEVGLSDFFVAAVIVAIVGNAAEHGGAVVVAYRGKIKLAAEIALASSAQVAVFLIPAVALIAWLIEPLALSFRPVEIVALAGSVIFAAAAALGRPLDPLARRRPDRRLRRRWRSRFFAAGDRGA